MIQIGGLEKSTLIDFPGRVAATIFLIGCNFRCPFCHSPELVLPERIKNHPRIPEKYVFDFLQDRKGLLEGVCLTGGEPTLYSDLPQFIKKIKDLGFLVKLDTNGSNPAMLKKLIDEKLVDYVAMDIKAPLDAEKYDQATGIKNDLEKIKKSIEILKKSGIDYEFRTTVVPAIHAKEDIVRLAKDIAPARRYCVQNFRAGKTLDPEFSNEKSYSDEDLSEIREIISPLFESFQLR